MTTSTAPTTHDATAAPRDGLRIAGISGIAGVALTLTFVAASAGAGGANALMASPAAISKSLADRAGSGPALALLALSAVSYVPIMGFLGGLRVLLRRIDPSGFASSIVAVASALFLGGAVASDGFNLSLQVAQHLVPSFQATPPLAELAAAGWLVCIVEAQVALATICLVGAVAAIAARRRGTPTLPRFVPVWGILGAAAAIPMLAAPSVTPVFALSSVTRLVWLAAVAVVMVRTPRSTLAR